MTSQIADQLESMAVPIGSVNPDPSNARKHDQRNIDTIKNSLARFGQRLPLVVQKQGMIVRAGNGRLEAAKQLGWESIAVLVVDESSVDATAFAIADNRSAELASWDDETLGALLSQLREDDFPTVEIGFDDTEIGDLLGEPAEITEDEVPEPPEEPVARRGQIWKLGRHRVMCGDATEGDDWARLPIRDRCVCFTSPPYNLGKSFALRGSGKADSGNAYDQMDDHQDPLAWRSMVNTTLNHAMKYCEAAVYNVQPLAGNRRELLHWIAGRDDFRDIATWDKGHAAPQMAEGVMASRFEWLVIFGRGKSTRRVPLSSWRGTIQSVYAGPPQRNNEYAAVHGATFPVHLPAWVISELCNTASAVADCFMGTGTTLIAAEQLGRTCYGIEISPAYVDVIVKRWENLTGERAEVIEDVK